MPIGDPLATWTSALIQGSGANGSTVFTDISVNAKAVTRTGSVSISNVSPKFGSGSILIPTAAYLSLPANDDQLTLGNSQWSVEFWLKIQSTSVWHYPLFMGNGGSDQLSIRIAPGGSIQVVSAGGTTLSAGTLAINTWYHIAVTRDGPYKIRLFLNGVEIASTTNTTTLSACSVVAIGAVPANSWYSTNINMDDIRITRFVSRYNANFTPPTALSLPYAARVSGTIRDSAGAPAARTVRVYRRDNGALLKQTVSDPTTGDYTAALLQDGGECNVVFLDDAAGTTYNDLIARAMPY